jgi:hypothetical protein
MRENLSHGECEGPGRGSKTAIVWAEVPRRVFGNVDGGLGKASVGETTACVGPGVSTYMVSMVGWYLKLEGTTESTTEECEGNRNKSQTLTKGRCPSSRERGV